MNDLGTHNAAPNAGVLGACAACGKPAASNRAFCGHCGARLWNPCIDCGARNNVAERFCCECGVDLHQTLGALQADLDGRLASAAQLEQAGDLLAAHQALEGAPEHDHSQLTARIDLVRRRRTELQESRLRAIAERGTRIEQAKQLQQQRKYADAFVILEQIPTALRDQGARQLIAEIAQPLEEIKRLRATLAASLKDGRPNGVLKMAERLVELEPGADDVRRVWEQLKLQQQQRDTVLAKKLLAKAREAIAANDYATARQYMERMPLVTDENEFKLCQAIEERVWLEREIRTQPFADKTLLRLSERLCKLQPTDEKIRKLSAEMNARLTRAENSAGRPYTPWGKIAGSSRFAAPVEPITNLPTIHWQADRREVTAWVADLRQYLVALGLALGGLGDAPLADLEFKTGSSTWLDRLTGGRRRKSAAWGVDIGTYGLKALRLVREGEVITVDRACHIPYSVDHTRNESLQIQPLIGPAFEKFMQQSGPGNEPLVTSFPGVQSLGRFFSLPRMKPAKLEKALAIEISNQIPLPPDEVLWQSHVWQPPTPHEDAAQHHVAVVAAKKTHIEMRTGALSEQGSRQVTLQSESVALLNTLMHCFHDQIAQLAANEALALVEIGDSAMQVVAICPSRGPWFRTIHRGIRSLNRFVVDALGVTWQQADHIRQQWPGSRPMAALDRTIAPAIEELSRDLDHALRAFTDLTSAKITGIYVAGGGCDQFGLLREWSRSGGQSVASLGA